MPPSAVCALSLIGIGLAFTALTGVHVLVQLGTITSQQLTELRDSMSQEIGKLQASIALVTDRMDRIEKMIQAMQQFLDKQASSDFKVKLRCLLNRWNELTEQRAAGMRSDMQTCGKLAWYQQLVCSADIQQ